MQEQYEYGTKAVQLRTADSCTVLFTVVGQEGASFDLPRGPSDEPQDHVHMYVASSLLLVLPVDGCAAVVHNCTQSTSPVE
jgi:hypothetical protein